MDAAPERIAFVSMLNPRERGADALGVIDFDPASSGYGELVTQVDMPTEPTSCTISDRMQFVPHYQAATTLTQAQAEYGTLQVSHALRALRHVTGFGRNARPT
jgi:hypothetical protein